MSIEASTAHITATVKLPTLLVFTLSEEDILGRLQEKLPKYDKSEMISERTANYHLKPTDLLSRMDCFAYPVLSYWGPTDGLDGVASLRDELYEAMNRFQLRESKTSHELFLHDLPREGLSMTASKEARSAALSAIDSAWTSEGIVRKLYEKTKGSKGHRMLLLERSQLSALSNVADRTYHHNIGYCYQGIPAGLYEYYEDSPRRTDVVAGYPHSPAQSQPLTVISR
jgi:hypothetical protein